MQKRAQQNFNKISLTEHAIKMSKTTLSKRQAFLLCACFFLPVAAQLSAQNTTLKNSSKTNSAVSTLKSHNPLSLKFYTDFAYEKVETETPADTFRIERNLSKQFAVNFAFGFNKMYKNGVFWEASTMFRRLRFDENETEQILVNQNVSTPSRGSKTTEVDVATRFEVGFPIYSEDNGAQRLFIGAALDPSVFFNKLVPFTTNVFPTTTVNMGLDLTAVPRWQMRMSERLILDVNVPIRLVKTVINFSQNDDPTFPISERMESGFNAKFSPNIQLRVGLGIVL